MQNFVQVLFRILYALVLLIFHQVLADKIFKLCQFDFFLDLFIECLVNSLILRWFFFIILVDFLKQVLEIDAFALGSYMCGDIDRSKLFFCSASVDSQYICLWLNIWLRKWLHFWVYGIKFVGVRVGVIDLYLSAETAQHVAFTTVDLAVHIC